MNVTIIMPVYNGESTVHRAIESIMKQDYENWELILIDDGSTDSTFHVLDKYSQIDSRIKIVKNPKRLGLASSLNKAIHSTKNELIARMDADDISLPFRIRKQVEFLVNNPAIDVLGVGAEIIDSRGESLGFAILDENDRDLKKNVYKRNPFIHPTVMFRRTFIERVGGYDISLLKAQDYDLWFRAAAQNFVFYNLQFPIIQYKVKASQSFSSIYYSGKVIAKAFKRDKRYLYGAFYLFRNLIANLLTKINLYNSRLR